MHRDNFREGSVEQIIFDYWDGQITEEEFLKALSKKVNKDELVEFIHTAQSKGLFGSGFIHP